MHLQRWLPLYRPRAELRPRSTGPVDGLRLRWLGTAGHVVSFGATTLLIDPFLTRPGPLATLAGRLRPTPESWWHHLPPRVDAVLLGHSHYDHLLDAPTIARRTGALIVGSASTAAFARAEGVPEGQIVTVPPTGRSLTVGAARVTFVPSLHGKIVAGRVPFDGEVRGAPEVPARLWDYRMGGAFGVAVELGGVRVYHNGSANLVDAELDGVRADVALVGLAGRKATPRYLERLARALSPRLIVPTHHDAFFAPLEAGARLLPGIDLDGFVADARRVAPDASVITPGYDDTIVVPGDDRARDAVVVDTPA